MPEDELRPEGTVRTSGNGLSNNSDARMMSGSELQENRIDLTEPRPEMEDSGETDEIDEIVIPNNKHNVTIHSLDFGYNVKIGCQNFAVETVEKLIKNLEAFLNDPRGTEKKWTKERKLL